MSAEPSKSSGDPETPGIRETSEADGTPAPAPARHKRSLPMFTEVIIALIAVALVQTFLIKPFGVPSQSMENTLQIGDRIVVNRLDDDVRAGDVIVFGHGETWQAKELPPADNLLLKGIRAFGDLTGIGPSSTSYTVKRIIGMPGQKVACCTDVGAVTVDGKPLTVPYVFEALPFVPGIQDCTTSPRCQSSSSARADMPERNRYSPLCREVFGRLKRQYCRSQKAPFRTPSLSSWLSRPPGVSPGATSSK